MDGWMSGVGELMGGLMNGSIDELAMASTHSESWLQLFKRLCLAFTGGLNLPHAWMLALASIENALETKEWAVSDCHNRARA